MKTTLNTRKKADYKPILSDLWFWNRIPLSEGFRYDSISTDNVIFSYEIIREKYLISIDSIIEQEKPKSEILKTIETPDFVIIY